MLRKMLACRKGLEQEVLKNSDDIVAHGYRFVCWDW